MDPPGNTDRILDFSTAATGTLFFVPSGELLESLAPEDEGEAADGDSDAGEPAPDGDSDSGDPGDGSLGIGSLRPA